MITFWRSTSCMIILGIALFTGCVSQDHVQKMEEAEATRDLGEAYLAQGNPTRALREFMKAEKLNPEDPFLHNDLGLAYLAKGRVDLAITHFKKALALSPDYAPARNNLGSAHLADRNWDAAIATLDPLTENLLYATPHYPISNMGWAYYNKKKYHLALRSYEEAIDLAPEFITAIRGRGLTRLALGEPHLALKDFNRALDLNPEDPDLWFRKGTALEQLHRFEEAIFSYKKVLGIDDTGETAVAAEARLRVLQ